MTTDNTPTTEAAGSVERPVRPLVACPLCGSHAGYQLCEGDSYRWWGVACQDCGQVIAECHSDRRTITGITLPDRWPDADKAWNEAGAHAEDMRALLDDIRAELEQRAMRLDENGDALPVFDLLRSALDERDHLLRKEHERHNVRGNRPDTAAKE